MQPKVDKDTCIGCGTCSIMAPKSFQMTDDGKAKAINPAGDDEETVTKAKDACPVHAISL
ncbi:ferredoxin [Patescibacteria group bacterium]|nr:ferredoxin [Patescibacteria group bacterium]MBU1895568.1 ferredoxin [Patescibacteria group bacterium]